VEQQKNGGARAGSEGPRIKIQLDKKSTTGTRV
jgi:hypothetical protein